MESFPAFFPLAGRTVVVAGEGEAAEAKARLFEGAPSRLVRLRGAAALHLKSYAGATLAFIAGPASFAADAAAAARRAGALVNVVDQPALSDFQTPAIIDRGAVTGAIGTGGVSPVLASELRNALEASWPAGLGALAELFRVLQPEVRARLPEVDARRAYLRALMDGPAAAAALAGDAGAALRLARATLLEPPQRMGVIQVLRAPRNADELTLGALRALGRADRIVTGAGTAPSVLAMGRRDAIRGGASEVTGKDLAAWAASGEAVVRIVAPGDGALDVEAARELGAPVAQLPG